MEDYSKEHRDEQVYLDKTIDFIKRELTVIAEEAFEQRKELIEARKDMVENTTPSSSDFEDMTEMVQALSEVKSLTIGYANIAKQIKIYKKLLDSPYFGRFDFIEDDFGLKEQIYIGLGNVMDRQTHEVYVYDWRAPISSIFYRYELGKASYETPLGVSTGEVLLKRQYKIKNSELKYFFDCSIRIIDEILQEILGKNTSAHMRNIVETIQKEQDIIIRDTDNELLIVQGSAGSGKTSIALHRIAFLLYEGLNKLSSNNIIIISPNDVFSQYISSVLPELGEENVVQATFDDIVANHFSDRFKLETKESYLEKLIASYPTEEGNAYRQASLFKGSKTFQIILDRWIWYYGHKLIPFEDAYFNGVVLDTRQQLKNRFLNNEIAIPMAKLLQRIESMLLPKTKRYKKERLEKIKKIVSKSEGRDFEILQFSRLLSIRESQAFRKRLRRFTEVDYFEIYQKLFSSPEYILKLSQDLTLPDEIKDIIDITYDGLKQNQLSYSDFTPLLYLKLKIEGSELASDIKHVVIDEAQDYSYLQYQIFKELYRSANFTVLGDINQTIDKENDLTLYDDIINIFNKEKSAKLFLTKSYRSSFEINSFNSKLIEAQLDIQPFERHGNEPSIIHKETHTDMEEAIITDIHQYIKQGYGSIAVICKNQQQAEDVHLRLKKAIKIGLIKPNAKDYRKGALVVSAYMAKGLEFDAVIVYDVNADNYMSNLDQKLLYISCTRALHELKIYYTEEKSRLILQT